MNRLAIIGSSDLGQLIAYHAKEDCNFNIAGFFDDFKAKDSYICGYRVIGDTDFIEEAYENNLFDFIMLGIGYKHMLFRKSIFEKLQNKIPFATIIHPSSIISKSCTIKDGTFILPGCILDNNVIVGENVLINTGCVIAHDSKIGKHTFISPSVAIAGFVKIGECCNIGINTTIIDNIIVCDNVQTGGATVIIKDITKGGLYVGNPSRFVR